MSVRRVVGLETEFGITGEFDPITLSNSLVSDYRAKYGGANWDYNGEDPLNDARGYRLDRSEVDRSLLTDVLSTEVPNAGLANGGRFYVDHAHPEYSTPEVINPREAVLWDRAGVVLARRAMAASSSPVVLYKNNLDGKGAAYGSHENYLVDRALNFNDIIQYLTPFFVTRTVLCGSGRVGLGQKSQQPGFQISQRADYVENDVGLETTFNRPIINTRDEPHTDASRYRRLHVIGGDANLFDISNLLKVGTTALVLWLLEQDRLPLELDSLLLYDPVRASWEVSHDLSLRRGIDMRDGSQRTALDIQEIYLDAVRSALDEGADFDTAEILERWQWAIDTLRSDMFAASAQIEWVAKYQLLDSLRERGGGSWDSDKLRAFDLQWHDLRPERSIVAKLEAANKVERLFDDSEVEWAAANAPNSTRAHLRAKLIQDQNVVAANWSSVTVKTDTGVQRIDLSDPMKGE